MNLKNTINPIILFTITILILFIGIVYFVYNNNQPSQETCATPIPQFICGTNSISEDAVEGKHLFNTNCAACHKLDAQSTGPGLRATDSVVFWKWMTPKKATIDSTKFD